MKRKWIDLLLFYATLMIIISGIILYIMPHGRVAYFTGWKFLGVDKDGWDNIHVIFGFLMVVVAVWHILINWKVMKKYLLQKESVFALLITSVITAGTIANVQPFKSVSDLEEMIKDSWEVNKKSVPISHAELMTLKEFCERLNINLNGAVKKLKSKNFKFSINDTLKTIAKNNNTTPADIYEIIKNAKAVAVMPGSGYGKMRLEDVCKKEGIKIDKCLKILKNKGIKADPKKTLREIAFPNGLTPIEIMDMIKKQEDI
ncbi:DUF4405 domain-containing protein [Nautilia lithotrophica]